MLACHAEPLLDVRVHLAVMVAAARAHSWKQAVPLVERVLAHPSKLGQCEAGLLDDLRVNTLRCYGTRF